VTPERDDLARTIDPACTEPSVLVVEDDLDLARVMTSSLQNHGIRTLHAPNGCDAIRLSTQQTPNLIVLDPGLPDMSGFAVVEALRKNDALAHIPIIVYSALEVRSADQPRLRLGPTEFLTKSRCTPAEFERHVIRLIAAVVTGSQHAA
jgi:CheY-like chemotaxis protein